MPLSLIVTGDDCVEGDLSKPYGRHLFNWGSDSGKDGHACGGGGYSKSHSRLKAVSCTWTNHMSNLSRTSRISRTMGAG